MKVYAEFISIITWFSSSGLRNCSFSRKERFAGMGKDAVRFRLVKESLDRRHPFLPQIQ
jgi:hypothetical protein